MANICPVCNYNGLYEPPYNKYGRGSDEICPCCGFQFGLDDYPDKEAGYEKWRKSWVNKGCTWFSKFRLPPADYSPVVLTLETDEEPELEVPEAD